MMQTAIIPEIIDQHAEEAAFLWQLRDAAVTAPHYNLQDLANLDERVEAHIDGLRLAGEYGRKICKQNLQFKQSGEVFAAAVLAIEASEAQHLYKLYSILEQMPETLNGLVSAFGWLDPKRLHGIVSGLLVSKKPMWRRVGIAVCAIHRVDANQYLEQAIGDKDILLSCRALRAAGELGRVNLKSEILHLIKGSDPQLSFWAAWSAVLLGDRGVALEYLRVTILRHNELLMQALPLVMGILDLKSVNKLLGELAANSEWLRMAIIGSGLSGDPLYIPWLIKQMENPEVARVAGESVSLITGVDIAYHDLECDPPEDFSAGPTEAPDDEQVNMDPDEDLPWPEPQLINQWWQQQQQNYRPNQRYLLGKPVTKDHCVHVLKEGFQRQRIAAAYYLCLLNPGTQLFPFAAPGKRQKRLLEQL